MSYFLVWYLITNNPTHFNHSQILIYSNSIIYTKTLVPLIFFENYYPLQLTFWKLQKANLITTQGVAFVLDKQLSAVEWTTWWCTCFFLSSLKSVSVSEITRPAWVSGYMAQPSQKKNLTVF